MHIDSWLELDIVDGWKIELAKRSAAQKEKLFFVNLGAYNGSDFTELHAVSFHVADAAPQAKAAALARNFTAGVSEPHKDDLLDIDDCLAIESVGLERRVQCAKKLADSGSFVVGGNDDRKG